MKTNPTINDLNEAAEWPDVIGAGLTIAETSPEPFDEWAANRKEMLTSIGIAVPTGQKFWRDQYDNYVSSFSVRKLLRFDTDKPIPMNHTEDIWLASQLYTRYCESVGGKAFNGDKLPTWDEFHADQSKATQAKAWIEVAIQARKLT